MLEALEEVTGEHRDMRQSRVVRARSHEEVRELGGLFHHLRRKGAVVALRDDNVLELVTCYGARTPMIVRWRPGQRVVQATQPLEIAGCEGETLTRAALAVARINQLLPVPALAIDLAAGSIEYRTQLFAARDGALDVELFEHVVARTIHHVERAVTLLDEWLRGEDHDLDLLDREAFASVPWQGYSE